MDTLYSVRDIISIDPNLLSCIFLVFNMFHSAHDFVTFLSEEDKKIPAIIHQGRAAELIEVQGPASIITRIRC